MATSRRRLGAIGLLVLLGLGGKAFAQQSVTTLTFDQAWQQALRQTPEMLKSRAQIAEAQGAVRAARGHLLPKLQASLTGSGSNSGLNVFGMKLNQGVATFNDFGAGQFNPSSLFTAPDNLNNPGWYRNYQSKLELQIPVYNGGKVWGYFDKAQAYLRAARQGDQAARQKLTLQVLQAYEGVRAAQAFVGVAAKAEAAAKSYVEITDKLYARGVVSRNDQLRAQLNLGDVQLRRSQAQAHLGKAVEQLRVLIGMSEGAPLKVGQSLSVKLPDASLVDLQRQAQADNPGLRALELQLQGARAGVNVARADYLPHFNVVVSREWNDPSFGMGGRPSNTVAGVLSWNLFDFGARRGGLDQANAQVTQQIAQLRQSRDQLRLKIDSAWRDVRLAQQRVKVRELAITQAEEARRLERLRYEKGVATMTELLAAQAELDKARSELVAARYQEVMQRAGLLLGVGRLTPDAIVARAGGVQTP
ncbi:MAG: TolC family protein [Acidihalobacter sp.]